MREATIDAKEKTMTTATSKEISGVIEATVKLVSEQLKAKWGSLQDCCTDANEMIYSLLKDGIELQSEFFIPSIERMQGVVRIDGEEVRHEWIRIDGVEYDATAEQFAAGVEYVGDAMDW